MHTLWIGLHIDPGRDGHSRRPARVFGRQHLGDVMDHRSELKLLHLQRETARLDAGDHQDVFDQVAEVLGLGLDDAQELVDLGGFKPVPLVAQRFDEPGYGGERGPQLVTDDRHELVLEAHRLPLGLEGELMAGTGTEERSGGDDQQDDHYPEQNAGAYAAEGGHVALDVLARHGQRRPQQHGYRPDGGVEAEDRAPLRGEQQQGPEQQVEEGDGGGGVGLADEQDHSPGQAGVDQQAAIGRQAPPPKAAQGVHGDHRAGHDHV